MERACVSIGRRPGSTGDLVGEARVDDSHLCSLFEDRNAANCLASLVNCYLYGYTAVERCKVEWRMEMDTCKLLRVVRVVRVVCPPLSRQTPFSLGSPWPHWSI